MTPEEITRAKAAIKEFRRAVKHETGSFIKDGTRGRLITMHAYFAPDRDPSDPITLFQHIPKTAGTALQHLIHLNYRDAELRVVAEKKPATGVASWYREFYGSLSADERQSLCCLVGHSVNYLLPLIERPVRAISMLREPVDRALSRYFFMTRRPDKSLREIFEGPERGNFHRFFNGQAKSLLAPHHDVGQLIGVRRDSPEAAVWRERLFEVIDAHYKIGVKDQFQRSARLFAETLGWETVAVPRGKVNPRRPQKPDLDDDTAELIRARNWLDLEASERYSARLAAWQPRPAGGDSQQSKLRQTLRRLARRR